MATIKPLRPDLNEERLNTMQARASQVWRGEILPKQALAEDVLHLVAEVRLLRKKAKEQPDTGFGDLNSLPKEMDSLQEMAAYMGEAATWVNRKKPTSTQKPASADKANSPRPQSWFNFWGRK